jgi:hypothetical protein
VIEDLLAFCKDNFRLALVYFYFDFSDASKQNAVGCICSLVRQLAVEAKKIPDSLEKLYINKVGYTPSLQELLSVFKDIMSDFDQVFIVLDALDECTDDKGLKLALQTISGWNLSYCHIFMASRQEAVIEEVLDQIEVLQKIGVQGQNVQDDIAFYIHQRMRIRGLWQKNLDIYKEIEAALLAKSDGM